MTSAGRLLQRKIIHMKGHKNINGIKKLIRKLLIETDRLGLTSLALPMIGTGMSFTQFVLYCLKSSSTVIFDSAQWALLVRHGYLFESVPLTVINDLYFTHVLFRLMHVLLI